MKASKVTVLAVAGALGVGGLGAVALGGPALARTVPSAAADAGSDAPDDQGRLERRVAGIAEALAGLVGDGTLTQAQADEVASTLVESDALRGPGGGHGRGDLLAHGLDAAAGALGLSEPQVRDALRDDRTLADLAGQQGVEVHSVVDALVAAAERELADAVAAGRMSADRADRLAGHSAHA